MSLIEKGVQEGLINFDETGKTITYTLQKKKRNFNNPEERVQTETYLQLVFTYGYRPDRIKIYVPVKMGVERKEADIIVFNDDEHNSPHIIAECKKPEVSDAEFQEAVDQAFSYAVSEGAAFVWTTSYLKNEYYEVLKTRPRERRTIADIPKFGAKEEVKYKYTKGGINGLELQLVSESELARRFKQAHDTLWAGGERNPSEAFDELDKIIFCKLWDENKSRRRGEPYDFQVFTGEKPDRLLSRIKRLYNDGRQKEPDVFNDSIGITAEEMQTIVGYLAPVNLTKTDLDSKGKAFETFLGSFFRGEFGQYFTPRAIVKFVIESLPISNESIILDPACGSGGFLLYALDKIRTLADEKAKEGYFDPGSREHYDWWHDFAENNLYGIEINKGIARTAKMNMIIHDDGHTNVVNNDALEGIKEKIFLKAVNNNSKGFKNFKSDNFDLILTNPPFGSIIKKSEKKYFSNYNLAKKDYFWINLKLKKYETENFRAAQNSEILFIEQCYNFLKVDGYLAMVVPDGILTNSSLQYVRNWIEEHFRIVAIISMPQTAFMHTGAGVKSSVIFLKKYDLSTTKAIQLIKRKTQDELFDMPEYGPAIIELQRGKIKVLHKGDSEMKRIEETLELHLAALREQDSLTKQDEKILRKETKEKIKAHKKTEGYLLWEEEIKDEFKEKIENLEETLNEVYTKKVKERVQDYPIFMAIAEDIGYDAAGRTTGKNELIEISKEIYNFIVSIEKGKESFFQLALA